MKLACRFTCSNRGPVSVESAKTDISLGSTLVFRSAAVNIGVVLCGYRESTYLSRVPI